MLLLYQESSQFRLNLFMSQGKMRNCYDWTRDTQRRLYGQKAPEKLVGFNASFRTVRWSRIAVGVCTWMRKKSPSTARENRSKLVRCTDRTETDMVLHLAEASGDQWSAVADRNPWQTSCLDLPAGYTASLKGHRIVLLSSLYHQEDKSSLNKPKSSSHGGCKSS